MKIRKAVMRDAEACVKIRSDEDRWSSIDFSAAVGDKHCIFLVAEKDKKIVGYCIGFIVPTQRKEAMLHETRVTGEERGSGVGTELVKKYCSEAFRKGVKDIYALIEPRHLKFYGKSGFRKNNKWIELKKSC